MTGRDEVLEAQRDHAIACGLLIGTCERDDRIEENEPKPAAAGAPAPNRAL